MSFIIVVTASLLVKNASSQVIKSSPKAIAPNAIYIQPINSPTVAVGTERLRLAPTPFHDDGMIEDLITALKLSFESHPEQV
jgi:7-keto-8-aminopelargonate synthetase-like enzyme